MWPFFGLAAQVMFTNLLSYSDVNKPCLVECTVWQWFAYDEQHARSVCLAVLGDGKECGRKIAGKNTTNLKVINFLLCHLYIALMIT